MTGGSLGLRTGSYGSLLLQQQQQQLLQQQQLSQQQQQQQRGVAGELFTSQQQQQQQQIGVRKGAKMVPQGPRERALAAIYRIAGRRKVGMLLLAIVSVVVFVSILSASSKDDDTSEGPGISWTSYSRPLINQQKRNSQPRMLPEQDEQNVTSPQISQPTTGAFQGFLPPINTSLLSSRHPCETVAIPPPPPDSKRTGPRPCEVCYAPVEHALALMPSSLSASPILKKLTYFSKENSNMNVSDGGSDFGGHPSLQDRNNSFKIMESMTVHCGFFNGPRPGKSSGFDIDEEDLLEMEKCNGLVVASAIFGNYDIIQQPKNVGDITKKYACFYMFLDEETESYVKNTSVLDERRQVGLWRIIVVRNLPYADARRNGKVPKLLLHRLFPNARYSLWIDGKLELVVDPFQVLERFLWRRNATFAISRHYRRFDVFEEAEANKAAGKYDNASIDFQVEFYKGEGLTHYSESKLPITSDVPEGCVIIKEHIPITNLFTCLWFNEVDRFTSRDQLSFSTVRDRLMSQVNWSIEMFWDCERRNFVVQAYHKDLLDYMKQHPIHPPPRPLPPKPPARTEPTRKPFPLPFPEPTVESDTAKKISGKRGKERRPTSKRRRSRMGNSRESSSI